MIVDKGAGREWLSNCGKEKKLYGILEEEVERSIWGIELKEFRTRYGVVRVLVGHWIGVI
jgi:hypothetical protein